MIHFLFSCTGYSSDILILYIITPLSELKQEHCMIIALISSSVPGKTEKKKITLKHFTSL